MFEKQIQVGDEPANILSHYLNTDVSTLQQNESLGVILNLIGEELGSAFREKSSWSDSDLDSRMRTYLDSMNGYIGWPKRGSFIVSYTPKRLEIVKDDPVFDTRDELMLRFRTIEDKPYSIPLLKRGGERNSEVAAQIRLLKKMAEVAFLDGDMINLERIFAQPLKRSDMDVWSEPFVERLDGKDIRAVYSVPTRGLLPAYDVCRRLPGAVLFFYPSKEDSLPKIHLHTKVITGETFSHRAGAMQKIFLDEAGAYLVKGENVAFIDDIFFNGGTAITSYEMWREAGANVVFFGAYIDKGYGALEKIEKATGIKPYCILEIDQGNITPKGERALVHFHKPHVYMRMACYS